MIRAGDWRINCIGLQEAEFLEDFSTQPPYQGTYKIQSQRVFIVGGWVTQIPSLGGKSIFRLGLFTGKLEDVNAKK